MVLLNLIFGKDITKLLELSESVISHEKLVFVEKHQKNYQLLIMQAFHYELVFFFQL